MVAPSKPASGPKLPQGRSMFGNRIIDALEKRLQPVGPLHRKELAFAVKVHHKTVDRWMRREIFPSAELSADMVRYFWLLGDREFAEEIFWIRIEPPKPVIPPPSAPVAAALAALDQARQALLEGAAA